MDLSEKIKQILFQKNITPSLFADEIGIQRSSISHILAGRNKPSLDIVQKIIKRFPDLGLNWILDDEDLPAMNVDQNTSFSASKLAPTTHKIHVSEQPESVKKKSKDNLSVQRNVAVPPKRTNAEKTIDKVLIFYSDGTFQEFKQPS